MALSELYKGEEEIIIMPEEIPELKQPEFYINLATLKHVISQVNVLVDEATFEVNPEGITFRGMDPSHVALIDITMPYECFLKFEQNIKPTKFGIMVDTFLKVLRNFDKKDTLETKILDGHIALRSPSFFTSQRLIEFSSYGCPLPKLNFNAELELGKDALKKIIGIQSVSEYVMIESKEQHMGAFLVSGKGDLGEANSLVQAEQMIVKEESKTTYSLNYLVKLFKNIIRDMPKYGTVTLSYSTKMPLKLSYKINGVSIDYYLAPRVSD